MGAWIASRTVAGTPANIEVDLMVPDAVGDPGRRAARLQGHAKEVARKARGLEAALIDKAVVTIQALEPTDTRAFDVAIAGPTALLIVAWKTRTRSISYDSCKPRKLQHW